MYRFITNVSRVIRQQFGSGLRATSKDDVGKPKKAVIIHTQPPSDLIIKTSYSSFNGEHSEGPEREQRKGYDPHEDFWWYVQHNHSSLEALGWGAAVVLGIHLKPLTRLLYDDHPTHPALCPSVLHALGAPLPSHTKSEKSSQQADQATEIDKLCAKFTKFYDDYVAKRDNHAAEKCLRRGDHKAAIGFWKKSCLAGNSKAQFNLGLCYERGVGVSKNLYKAVKFYQLAVTNGHAGAMYNLATLYLSDHDNAIPLVKGESSESRRQDVTTLMSEAAVKGVAEAQVYMGVHYTQQPQCDMAKAVLLFRDAAAQNNGEALYMLGVCHERGWGTEQNECKAADLYHKASWTGHPLATYNLAVMHELGAAGLPVDKSAAKDMYMKALGQGCEAAQEALDRLSSCEKATNQKHTNTTARIKRTQTHHGSSPLLHTPNSHHTSLIPGSHHFSQIIDSLKTARLKLGHLRPLDTHRPKATFYIGSDDSSDCGDILGKKLEKSASISCLTDLKCGSVTVW